MFLIRLIRWVAQLLMLLLAARAICSWFARPGTTAYRIYQILAMLTEPIVAPCRNITRRFNTGMLDISVLLAFFLVMLLENLLIRLILMFMF